MNAIARRTLLVAAALVALGAASVATAAPNAYLAPSTPRLGYYYNVIPGYGYRVVNVYWGTPAQRMGLEVGDTILSINGYSLTYNGAHVPAMQQAQYNGGWCTLRIRDWRTGWVVTRSVNLYGGGGGGWGGGGYGAASASR